LSVGRSLPICPQLRTFSAHIGMSQMCHGTELALCEAAALGDDLLSAREEIQTL
jgi:hypothetical protein